MIVGGVGVGLINPPLASTAVGVVRHDRAGMASGINSTFRQVGIATGIALQGTLFSNRVTEVVLGKVNSTQALSGKGPQIASAVKSGQVQQLLAHLPARGRQQVALITKSAFTDGLDRILLVGAIVAIVCGFISLAAIRGKDFAQQQSPPVAS
jgi:hypothetical protein